MMITFKRFLVEVLNKGYDMKRRWNDSNRVEYEGKTKNGEKIHIALRSPGEKGNWVLAFSVDNRISVTGKGDAYKIFASVINVIKEFIEDKNPKSITFSAAKKDSLDNKETGRVSLYNRMLKTLLKNTDYTFSVKDYSYDQEFVLKRKT